VIRETRDFCAGAPADTLSLRYNIPPLGTSTRPKRKGDPLATHVNLDALIAREDFEVIGEGIELPKKNAIQISELEPGAFFFGALRKPDFQRETAEWGPDRVVGLIRTFIEDDFIPGVILWQNKELLFVIDGSHRLSALTAWVQDDYGDGDRSQAFFGYQIPSEQLLVADRTRKLVEKEFGSYESHKKAIASPAEYGPDTVRRARRFGSLSLNLQWVTGEWKKAEAGFIRINQQAAVITPQELALIESRSKPHTIASRAIIRRATGHQYWGLFDTKHQDKIREVSREIHELIFRPELSYPIHSVDLPAGGGVYSSTALQMVRDFITICVGVPSPEDDKIGDRTSEYLVRCRNVMQLLVSSHPSSVGLHPAVYFYSWTGKQQPILFLTIAEILVELDRDKKLPEFIGLRQRFEEFLVSNRALLNQVIRKFGTKGSGRVHLRQFYDDVMRFIRDGEPDIVAALCLDHRYAYLQPAESPYEGPIPARYSTQVKSGLVLRELLPKAQRCAICGGYVPSQAISIDHKVRREDGGLATVDNAQLTHPYCNTGYKESLNAASKKKTANH